MQAALNCIRLARGLVQFGMKNGPARHCGRVIILQAGRAAANGWGTGWTRTNGRCAWPPIPSHQRAPPVSQGTMHRAPTHACWGWQVAKRPIRAHLSVLLAHVAMPDPHPDFVGARCIVAVRTAPACVHPVPRPFPRSPPARSTLNGAARRMHPPDRPFMRRRSLFLSLCLFAPSLRCCI